MAKDRAPYRAKFTIPAPWAKEGVPSNSCLQEKSLLSLLPQKLTKELKGFLQAAVNWNNYDGHRVAEEEDLEQLELLVSVVQWKFSDVIEDEQTGVDESEA